MLEFKFPITRRHYKLGQTFKHKILSKYMEHILWQNAYVEGAKGDSAIAKQNYAKSL